MNNYKNYIKCGEILKSSSFNEYVLKCLQCDDHYFVLESFIFPCANHCGGDPKSNENESIFGLLNESDDDDDNHKGNMTGSEHITIKFEDITDAGADEVDPLNIIKNNKVADGKMKEVKEECILRESEEGHTDAVADESLKEELVSNYSDDVNWEYSESDNESVESDDNKSVTFVHNFMKSEQNVISLIASYKNQTQLWNRNCPQFRLKKQHDKYLEEIREELKEKLNLQISCNQVAAVITHLCRKYRQDLKKMKLNEVHGEMLDDKNKPAWFFAHLDFLKPIVEKNVMTTLNSQKSDLVPEQIIEVLAIYERFPHLWNTHLVENVCKNKRLEALVQMQEVIESELDLKLSEIALKNNIHFIHNHFAKVKRCNPSNANTKNDRYYKHMQFLYDHVGPFKCSECGQVFKSPLTFRVHKSQHDGSTALKCSICNKEYSNSGPYISHARRHMADLSEECKECGKKFLVASDLKIHMRSHTGVQPYCCEICGISFRHSTSLNVHRRRHEKQYLHKCPICSKGFYKKDRMNDHIRSHNNIRDFVCKTCGKAFKTRKTLKQHEVTHEDVRKHACALCGKAFKLKVGLLQHMRTHGGQV